MWMLPWDLRGYQNDYRDGIGCHNGGVARSMNPNTQVDYPNHEKHRTAWFRGWDRAHEANGGDKCTVCARRNPHGTVRTS